MDEREAFFRMQSWKRCAKLMIKDQIRHTIDYTGKSGRKNWETNVYGFRKTKSKNRPRKDASCRGGGVLGRGQKLYTGGKSGPPHPN